jgi:hypothetical protein
MATMKVKLTDEELNAKREELGRVLKDIADAERARNPKRDDRAGTGHRLAVTTAHA